MAVDNAFGAMFAAGQISKAAKALILDWYDDYMQEAARILDVSTEYFPSIKKGEVLSMSEFEQEGRTYRSPTVIVAVPGMAETPTSDGDGIYSGTWTLGIGALAIVPFSHDRGEEISQAMAAAIRQIFLQHKSLGLPNGAGLKWVGETYNDRGLEDSQTMSEAFVRFTVDLDNVADSFTIPNRDDTPADDPTVDPGAYETATTVTVEID